MVQVYSDPVCYICFNDTHISGMYCIILYALKLAGQLHWPALQLKTTATDLSIMCLAVTSPLACTTDAKHCTALRGRRFFCLMIHCIVMHCYVMLLNKFRRKQPKGLITCRTPYLKSTKSILNPLNIFISNFIRKKIIKYGKIVSFLAI